VAVAIFTLLHSGVIEAEGLFFPLVPIWSTSLDSPPIFPPAYDDTQAYVARRDNQLAALSLETGKLTWSVECPMTAAPSAGDALVFSAGDQAVEARSQTDGTARWRTAIDGKVTSLYWDAGWLFASTDKGALLAMRGADGEVLWRRDLGAGLQASPAPAGARLYLALQTGALMALALETGEPAWTVQFEKPVSGILALGDQIFVGSLDHKFYCLSAKQGHVEWSWRTGADVIGVPAVDTKTVYFVSLDHLLHAHARNSGEMRWFQSMTTRPSAGPLLKGWTLMVPGISADLHAFSAVNGAPANDKDLVLRSAEGQETQFMGAPHLTADDKVITLTKSGQMQGFVSSPSPFGP
jgi:outer membrane protein assembly factor BamB